MAHGHMDPRLLFPFVPSIDNLGCNHPPGPLLLIACKKLNGGGARLLALIKGIPDPASRRSMRPNQGLLLQIHAQYITYKSN